MLQERSQEAHFHKSSHMGGKGLLVMVHLKRVWQVLPSIDSHLFKLLGLGPTAHLLPDSVGWLV